VTLTIMVQSLDAAEARCHVELRLDDDSVWAMDLPRVDACIFERNWGRVVRTFPEMGIATIVMESFKVPRAGFLQFDALVQRHAGTYLSGVEDEYGDLARKPSRMDGKTYAFQVGPYEHYEWKYLVLIADDSPLELDAVLIHEFAHIVDTEGQLPAGAALGQVIKTCRNELSQLVLRQLLDTWRVRHDPRGTRREGGAR